MTPLFLAMRECPISYSSVNLRSQYYAHSLLVSNPRQIRTSLRNQACVTGARINLLTMRCAGEFGASERIATSTFKTGRQALFLSGNTKTTCVSTVFRACFKMCARFSINHRATPATSRCATASSHSIFARFRQFAERFNAAISRSCKDTTEHSNRYSSGGRGFPMAVLPYSFNLSVANSTGVPVVTFPTKYERRNALV
jgi:hypothetical protein